MIDRLQRRPLVAKGVGRACRPLFAAGSGANSFLLLKGVPRFFEGSAPVRLPLLLKSDPRVDLKRPRGRQLLLLL